MGEIADDIINGFQCSWCGVCFKEEHGYPVICEDCWKNATKKQVKSSGVQKTLYDEL